MAVLICFTGYTTMTMAEKKVPDNEKAYMQTKEMALNYQLQLPSSMLMAQEIPGTADSASVPYIGASTDEMDEQAQIAEALANPLSYLWLIFMQNDTSWYDGDILDRLGGNQRQRRSADRHIPSEQKVTDRNPGRWCPGQGKGD